MKINIQVSKLKEYFLLFFLFTTIWFLQDIFTTIWFLQDIFTTIGFLQDIFTTIWFLKTFLQPSDFFRTFLQPSDFFRTFLQPSDFFKTFLQPSDFFKTFLQPFDFFKTFLIHCYSWEVLILKKDKFVLFLSRCQFLIFLLSFLSFFKLSLKSTRGCWTHFSLTQKGIIENRDSLTGWY